MIVYKIRPDDYIPVIEKNIDNIKEYIKESCSGQVWTIEVMEMTENEYNQLPEHQGF